MSKFVPDISTRRWVLIAPLRANRTKHINSNKSCVFCPNNEKFTPPEVLRIGNGKPNEPGWLVRVIPNRYPITDIHEVILHSPWEAKDIENLPNEHIELIFQAYRQRFLEYEKRGQVLIFCNYGKHAGASISHPHSQLVVIPNQINLDVLARHPVQNTVMSDNYFTAYCPDFSQWPYEVWIIPKRNSIYFGQLTDVEIRHLSIMIKILIKKLEHIYNYNEIFDRVDRKNHPFGFNYYIYPKQDWYLRIIPRLVHRAGFELGTGLSVNVVDPINAAVEISKAPPSFKI